MAITIIKTIISILTVITTFIMIYQLGLVAFSGKKRRAPEGEVRNYNNFAIIVPARNEEDVIGNIVESLKKQNYPDDKFDIYVIADNCTDNTASVAREHGALVFERIDTQNRNKGAALHWFFERINSSMPEHYDAYGIFDADNLVHSDYLSVMNRHLNGGADILQGYRDITNPSDSWVSGCYAVYFWFISRFFQRPRSTMGLPVILGGTGFVFKRCVVSNGWNTSALTEDTEFTIQNALTNRKIQLAEEAIFYDEQPVKFSQSIHQRYRWTLGSLQCLKLYFVKIVKSRNIKFFDLVMFLLMPPSVSLVVANAILDVILRFFGQTVLLDIFFSNVIWTSVAVAFMYLYAIFIVLLSRKRLRLVWKGLLLWPVFILSWTCISFVALFYRNTNWKPVKHKGKTVLLEG